MPDWFQASYWGNSIKAYTIAVGMIVIGFGVLRLIRTIGLKRFRKIARRTNNNIDDIFLSIMQKGILPLLYVILVYSALKTLTLSSFLNKALAVAIVFVLVFFVVRILIMIIRNLLEYYFKKEGRTETANAMNGVMIIVQVLLWIFGLVFLLGNLGYDIGAMLAGLGIGGIAVALAAQNILADVFAYFSILFDRPFEVGEFLIIGDQLGTVTHIGIKTTRIQSLSGEALSYSNQNMLNQWIHNYSRMEKRRAVFGVNVSYNTPADKLERIPDEIKKIINAQDKIQIDRVHFAQFKEYYLYFEAVYYSLEPGYGEYMDKQQNINLGICRKFEEMEVKFAFSTTHNIHLHQDNPPSDVPE